MTALILATKSNLSFFGSRIAVIRYCIGSAVMRFDEAVRERIALCAVCVAAALLCLFIVSVNIILGEGGNIGALERAIRSEEIALLDAEADFAIRSSAEQLKKNEVVRTMEDVGVVEYVRMNAPSLAEAPRVLP